MSCVTGMLWVSETCSAKARAMTRVVGHFRIQETIGDDVAKAQPPEARLMAEHVHIGVEGVIPGGPGDIRGSIGALRHHVEVALHIALCKCFQEGINIGKVAVEHTHGGARAIRHSGRGDPIDTFLIDEDCGGVQQGVHPVGAAALHRNGAQFDYVGEGRRGLVHP